MPEPRQRLHNRQEVVARQELHVICQEIAGANAPQGMRLDYGKRRSPCRNTPHRTRIHLAAQQKLESLLQEQVIGQERPQAHRTKGKYRYDNRKPEKDSHHTGPLDNQELAHHR